MKGKALTYKRHLLSFLVVGSIVTTGCAFTSNKGASEVGVAPEVAAATSASPLPSGSDLNNNVAGNSGEAPATGGQAALADAGVSKLIQEGEDDIRARIDPEALGSDSTSNGVTNTAPDAGMPQVTLRGLNFNYDSSDANTLVIELSNPAKVELKKEGQSEYLVRLKGATSDEIQPLLSKSQKNLIRSARVTKDGSDVVIRLFVSTLAELSTQQEGGVLKISARSLSGQSEASSASTSSAQFAPAPEVAKVDGTSVTPENSATPGANGEQAPGDVAGEKLDVTLSEGQATGAVGTQYNGRLISLDLQDTDIDNALRIIAEVSNLNIIASEEVTGKVTLRLIDVPWDQALDVILKTNGLDKVKEGNVVRIAPVDRLRQEREGLKQARDAEEELEPLTVRYLRVSYSKASELKQLVDGVLTERGNVAFDERTNQLIVKDIRKGVENAEELIKRLDLRTPQVLLETQIVESNRTLLRDIGAEFGYRYIQSPEIGNATGKNFPNSVDLGLKASNPAGSGLNPISLVLGSADGSKSLSAILTQAEADGRGRVVSRPSVATINNKPASIKSIERVRIRLPAGGVSVATGQGANAAGQGTLAAESIEVGIVLEVTPQASPDYYVLMDINAKSSTLGTNSVDGVPNEIERSATSSVLVSSGQTFALGGIYKLSETNTNTGLPFFKDIPVIGQLFRRTETRGSDEELLFFITPRIVEGSFDEGAMKAAF